MSPPAQAVWQAIESKTGRGVKFTRDDLAQLNQVIPDDLTSGELAALLEWLKKAKGKEAQDAFAILGALQDQISQMRSPESVTTVTTEG